MRIAIFGKQFSPSFLPHCLFLCNELRLRGAEIIIYSDFYDFIKSLDSDAIKVDGTFNSRAELSDVNVFISVGGDGTFLEAVTLVRDASIPILGINSGRLGFLADVAKEEIESAMNYIFSGNLKYKQLDLLCLETDAGLFGDLNFALNELTIQKRDSASMVTIHTYLNGELLNSYWADGLIIATPTGSTAYSLSVGGPIIHPSSKSFIINPIAPHNLTVRPIIVPNDMQITLKVEGRADKFLASLDSRSVVFEDSIELRVKKADFSISVVDLPGISYNQTLRNKLMWGADKRNY